MGRHILDILARVPIVISTSATGPVAIPRCTASLDVVQSQGYCFQIDLALQGGTRWSHRGRGPDHFR